MYNVTNPPTFLPINRILLGITGGIAAYKSAELVRLWVQEGKTVQVVMTESATQFVTPTTFQALSGRPVYSSLWDPQIDNAMAHIELPRTADVIVVAPASANFLAKLAHGLADDLLSTLCLARQCPLLVAPAMNKEMWDNPATQRNIAQLKTDGIVILGPASGDQACREVGFGRMLEPEEIAYELEVWAQPKLLKGKRVLISAGPTYEAIDPVRGMTNLSSGKMGFACARAAAEAGAEVVLVAGPTALPTPKGVDRVNVTSAAEMLAVIRQKVTFCGTFISAAAVADYTMAAPHSHKRKKMTTPWTLELVPTVDILAEVAGCPRPPFCVGFAAETENIETQAQEKRRRKKIPLMVANLAQGALGSDDNEVILLDDSGAHPLPRANKLIIARQIMVHIAGLIDKLRL